MPWSCAKAAWSGPSPRPTSAPRQLTLEHIQTDLRFLPNDEWALDNFKAGFLGAKVQLSGTLAHASAARDWKFLQPQAQPQGPGKWHDRLRQLADALQHIHFASPPELRLDAFGDARDSAQFQHSPLGQRPGRLEPPGAPSPKPGSTPGCCRGRTTNCRAPS